MKKNSVVSFFVVAAVFVFTSASPSVDGRAVVAEKNELPEGLFAKTVGYLPGDSISVTNMATRTTSEILVVGALDASEGVAILLSPEAANALGIPKNSNNIVQITKRSGQLDEAFTGNAIIARSDDKAVTPDDSKYLDDVPEHFVEKKENVPEHFSETHPEYLPETNPENLNEDTLLAVESESVLSERESDVVYDYLPAEQIDASDSIVTEKVDEPKISSEEIVYEYLPAEHDAEKIVADLTDDVVDTVADSDSEPYFEILDDELVVKSESVSEDLPDEVLANRSEVVIFEDLPNEVAEASVPSELFEDDELPAHLLETYHDPLEAEIVEVIEVSDDAEIVETEIALVDEDDNDLEMYEPIVLVPAEPNPPVAEMFEAEVVVNEAASDSAVETPAHVASVPATSTVNFSDDIQKYVVPNLQALESGKYYVQIASIGDNEKISGLISDYGKNYPLVLVPTASGKSMQLMVGPLYVDEYETVMKRFKSYGFTDAFMRKIR